MKKLYVIFAFLFAVSALGAQTVKGLGFAPDTVRPGESSTYSISISGVSPKISLNQIPIPEGLQFSGNGQSSVRGTGGVNETTIDLYFIPEREGEFEIKAWTIKDGNNTYEIPAATLRADPNAPQNLRPQRTVQFGRPQQRQAEQIDLNNEMGLSVKFAKEKIYTGETVPCTLEFKISRKIIDAGYTLGAIPMPQIKNSDAFNFAGILKEPRQAASGDNLSVVLSYETFITPIKAGEHAIEFELVGELVGNDGLGARSFFSMMSAFAERHPFRISMKPMQVRISELPAPPQEFSNAIGDFKIESAALDETSLSVGTPAVMTVKISGEGNFDRISAPLLEAGSDWKEYKPKTAFEDKGGGYSYCGVKTFEYTVVPSKPDLEKAPAAVFTFFNPATEAYETVSSEPISVSVAPSRAYASRARQKDLATDPLGELSVQNDAKAHSEFYAKPWFWCIQAALLAAVAFAAYRRSTKNRLENDPKYARMKKAKENLASALARAKHAASRNDAKAFFENSAAALQNAISAGSGIEARAVTLSDAQRILGELPNGEETFRNSKIFFEGADAIAFGGYTPQAGELAKLYETLEDTCSRIL